MKPNPADAPGQALKRSLGSLLRAKRKELGMTLQELAKKADLSAAFLSQAENGKATPSIISLINIAQALGTDVHYFITPPASKSLVRRADDPREIEVESPVTYYRLDADIRNQRMSALRMTVPPGVELPVAHRDEGEDFFYVLEGEIEQLIGDEIFTLTTGDSAHHNTQVNHKCINRSDKPAHLLWVGTPTLFPPTADAGDTDQ
ncbi:MAG: helix-turn-helix domain-containing protein [Gammaproteobacteria bacterium]